MLVEERSHLLFHEQQFVIQLGTHTHFGRTIDGIRSIVSAATVSGVVVPYLLVHVSTTIVLIALRSRKGLGNLLYILCCNINKFHNNTSLIETCGPATRTRHHFKSQVPCPLFSLPKSKTARFQPALALPTRLCNIRPLHCPTPSSNSVSSSFVS